VVRLGRGFADVAVEGESVQTGSGALDSNVALACQQAGVAGLEFLSGIPGTVGGNLRMNAGAYDTEVKDVLVTAAALDPEGGRHELTPAEMQLSYRRCGVPADWIFIGATFRGRKGDPAEIGTRIREIQAAREATQPVRARTGGSTFANPPGEKAWALIDTAGCRGLVRGGAMVSEKHANFLINTGAATAADLEELGEEVRRRVFERSGITLEWEIKRVGSR
jgi:UDP-N-acetylmuramate dehydrogenase